MNSEFKRMMELAGLTEIKVNEPSRYPGNRVPLIDYNLKIINPNNINKFGEYNAESNTFSASIYNSYFYNTVYKGEDINKDRYTEYYIEYFYEWLLEKVAREKYGNDVNIEFH